MKWVSTSKKNRPTPKAKVDSPPNPHSVSRAMKREAIMLSRILNRNMWRSLATSYCGDEPVLTVGQTYLNVEDGLRYLYQGSVLDEVTDEDIRRYDGLSSTVSEDDTLKPHCFIDMVTGELKRFAFTDPFKSPVDQDREVAGGG